MVDSAGIKHLPSLRKADMGNGLVRQHWEHEKPDVFITMMDSFVFNLPAFKDTRALMWAVIDSYPILPEMRPGIEISHSVIAMSKFGQVTLTDAGYLSLYVPLAIDTSIFSPSSEPRPDQRKYIPGATEDTFVVSMVGANGQRPSRKGFEYLFDAWAKFVQKHKDSVLYVHTNVHGETFGDGINILDLATFFKIPRANILFPNQYSLHTGLFSQEYMAHVYNASDCFILPSLGEGFGIPIVEAQACGTPVIVSDNSACSELCLTGHLVECTPFMYHPGTYRGIPNVDDIVAKLEKAQGNLVTTRTMDYKHRVRDRVMKYDINNVEDSYLLPVLTDSLRKG